MRKMKDSGIEWLGEIPSHWKSMPIGALFHEIRTQNVLGSEKKALQFKMGSIVPKNNFDADVEDYVANTITSYTLVDYGTIMINGLNLNFDFVTQRVALVKDKGAITSAYMAIKANDLNQMEPEYSTYLLKTYDNCKAFHNMGGGVRKILNFDELRRSYIIVPPVDEQKKIADYLDAKCSEIDALVADIQAQIETLEQYKRSTVIETVLKGLKPGLPTKDSKIDWVGAIPSHWNTHPMYYYFEERKHSNSLGEENNLLSLSYGKVIRKDINTNGGLLPNNFNTYNIIEKDDIVLRLTDLQNDRRSLRTGISKERGIITSAYVTLRATKVLNAQYFYYLLHAYDLMKVLYNMGSGVRQGLNYEELSKMMLIEPLLDEQNEIATFLDKKCDEINACIEAKKEQIATLEAYKKSIIFEYVTGKKEVE